MIICDMCGEYIDKKDHVEKPVSNAFNPAKDSPYREQEDWCKCCSDEWSGISAKIVNESRRRLHEELEQARMLFRGRKQK